MGVRHRAREAALRLLYQLELTGDETDSALGTYWSELPPKLATGRTYAEILVSAVRGRTAEIDALIDDAASNWQLSRIARIDLCILRIAVAEMLLSEDIPVEVVIDEAVELARAYSDAESPAFINGVLDRVARDRSALSRKTS